MAGNKDDLPSLQQNATTQIITDIRIDNMSATNFIHASRRNKIEDIPEEELVIDRRHHCYHQDLHLMKMKRFLKFLHRKFHRSLANLLLHQHRMFHRRKIHRGKKRSSKRSEQNVQHHCRLAKTVWKELCDSDHASSVHNGRISRPEVASPESL